MKTYRITITTEYIIEANTEDEAFDMIDYSYETRKGISVCIQIFRRPNLRRRNLTF